MKGHLLNLFDGVPGNYQLSLWGLLGHEGNYLGLWKTFFFIARDTLQTLPMERHMRQSAEKNSSAQKMRGLAAQEPLAGIENNNIYIYNYIYKIIAIYIYTIFESHCVVTICPTSIHGDLTDMVNIRHHATWHGWITMALQWKLMYYTLWWTNIAMENHHF